MTYRARSSESCFSRPYVLLITGLLVLVRQLQGLLVGRMQYPECLLVGLAEVIGTAEVRLLTAPKYSGPLVPHPMVRGSR